MDLTTGERYNWHFRSLGLYPVAIASSLAAAHLGLVRCSERRQQIQAVWFTIRGNVFCPWINVSTPGPLCGRSPHHYLARAQRLY